MRAMLLGALVVVAGVVTVASCATAVSEAQTPQYPEAVARMRSAEGVDLGEVRLEQTPHGVLTTLDLHGLPPGSHGFHIHEVGECVGDFSSAGEHFAPAGRSHGFRNPDGYHAGDLPNVFVPDDGRLLVEFFTPRVTLGEGSESLLGGDGTALILHENPDDYRSDPAGEAGARIACGVVEAR